MNKVFLCGHLTRDVETRTASNDTTVARVGIAVNRPFSKDKDAVDFFNLVAFNKTAEFMEKYFGKGSKALIEGSLRINNYEDKDGIKRTSIDVVVDQIEFADSKRKDGNSDSSYRRNSSTQSNESFDPADAPF